MLLGSAVAAVALFAHACAAKGPFFKQLNETTWVIGNDHWNLTQNYQYANKLYWKGKDLVDEAWGHYVSYSTYSRTCRLPACGDVLTLSADGAANDLAWLNASVVHRTSDYIDVQFNAVEGEFHWIIYKDLVGAYQYFVNRALPILGEFRTLWRLDNETFPRGRTTERDGVLPPLSEYVAATNVQDETWQKADGTFLTKYDWSAFIREQDYYGVYGDNFGSWYIVSTLLFVQTFDCHSLLVPEPWQGLLQRQPPEPGAYGKHSTPRDPIRLAYSFAHRSIANLEPATQSN